MMISLKIGGAAAPSAPPPRTPMTSLIKLSDYTVHNINVS